MTMHPFIIRFDKNGEGKFHYTMRPLHFEEYYICMYSMTIGDDYYQQFIETDLCYWKLRENAVFVSKQRQ